MVIHKSFSEFVLFLYIHMAYSDGGFHPSERTVILGKIRKIFPNETNPEKKLEEAEQAYKSVDKSQIINLIRDTFAHFDQVKFSQKYKVYTDLYDIIQADGFVDESEQEAINQLKEIIDVDAGLKNK